MKAYHAELRVDHGDWFTIYRGESLNDARVAIEADFIHLTFFERQRYKKENGFYLICCYEAPGETIDEVLENVLEDLNPDQFFVFEESYKIEIEELIKG